MKLVPVVFNSHSISEIAGSISIACWVIVFVPQIYENFYRKSSEGLSLLFIILWLAGDIFNFLGAVLQHLLPTMIILAGYYTVADIILLFQCLFYGRDNEVDPVHLSPANPINENVLQDVFNERQPLLHSSEQSQSQESSDDSSHDHSTLVKALETPTTDEPVSKLKSYIWNGVIVMLVILSGFVTWYISYMRDPDAPVREPDLELNVTAQVFGYLSAALYLGSRVPQLLLNFKRKSCEGISFLFFLFAYLGNITFIVSVLSISIEPRYLLVNASWLLGSTGTLMMDFMIFVQFFIYGDSLHRKPRPLDMVDEDVV